MWLLLLALIRADGVFRVVPRARRVDGARASFAPALVRRAAVPEAVQRDAVVRALVTHRVDALTRRLNGQLVRQEETVLEEAVPRHRPLGPAEMDAVTFQIDVFKVKRL